MRHAKHTFKVGRTGSHRRCMIANMLKSLIFYGRIETTVTKAKELRIHADKMVTLSKKEDQLSAKRNVKAKLMLRYNFLNSKEKRKVKNGDKSFCNQDRQILDILFNDLSKRFESRNGGYTRIIKKENRVGDAAPKCIIEYLK